jgi:glycosyltransferase involved in cell wall biosynthesis
MRTTVTMPNPNDKKPILTSPIKVLHIISGDLWAGAEVQAYTLLTSLPAEYELLVILMNYGELETRLKAAGIKTHVIDERQINSLKIISQLIASIRQFSPHVIHTHRQKENILGTIANLFSHWPTSKRARSLRTVHGAPEHQAKGLKQLLIKLDQVCGRYGQDAIISVSNDLTHKLQRQFPAKYIHTIHNGINVAQLKLISPATDVRKNAKTAIHIGIIGRLEPVKRVDLFLQTAAYLIQHASEFNFRFHIIGDGKLRQTLEQLTTQLGLTKQVRFHGHRSDSQAAIAALDIVVMCSDHEGTPMTALETLALGKPLIAHKVGGLAEILQTHPELLVDLHNPQGYAECILKQLNTPVQPSLPHHYTNSHNAKLTAQLYNEICNRPAIKEFD